MSFWQDKTVLIAGGAGFIGLHLLRALLDVKAHVHVVDNFSTSRRDSFDQVFTKGHGRVTLLDQDISDGNELPNSDIIYNLASPASPRHYQLHPIQTWKSNTVGTMHLLDHAQNCGATFVQASTSEVYGDPLSHPQKETDWGNVNPVGQRACYDESKRAAEALLMDAVRILGADVRIARIFNTYGLGMDSQDGRVIPNFIAQAQAGQPLTIYGDGSQTRSFCHVSDTVEGLLQMGALPAARGEVINIGNPKEYTIAELAERINGACKQENRLIHRPLPVDDPTRRCPDINKAQRLLGWTPQVTLDQGLATMICDKTISTACAQ